MNLFCYSVAGWSATRCGVLGGAKPSCDASSRVQLPKVPTTTPTSQPDFRNQPSMAPLRAYIPSVALIRALSRPQPLACPFARPIATSFIRGKRTQAAKDTQAAGGTQAAKAQKRIKPLTDAQMLEKLGNEAIAKLQDEDWVAWAESTPITEEELAAGDVPTISHWDMDLLKGTPKRLIKRLSTVEDWRKDKEMQEMIIESRTNPDYDDKELNRRLIDTLIENPKFAEFTDKLKEIKEGILSKKEQQEMLDEAFKQAEADAKEWSADVGGAVRSAFEELMNDPDAAAAKEELQEVLDKMPKIEEVDSPEFQAIVQKAIDKLTADPTWAKKMEAMKSESADPMKEFKDVERQIHEAIDKGFYDPEEDEDEEDEEDELMFEDNTKQDTVPPHLDLDPLLLQMRDVLKGMGGFSGLEAEMNAILAEDPMAKQDGDFEREMGEEELVDELLKLALAKAPEGRAKVDENVPVDLQAKVDKILADPKLMEKLTYIQQLIGEAAREKSDITAIAHEVAPDPYKLEDSRTATLKQRMQAAREDPEHSAAMDRLHVKLHPPFNISPALKAFNQAIEFAYIGANDDIRRILWRSYQKARALPTFLHNVSDEAWDILYYSQAVTWGSNQNRDDHLRALLGDLNTLGRNGPPTHPSAFSSGDGEHPQT
jgi:hypothetical protein